MTNPSKYYQSLPKMDSPAHLDDQILAEATRLVPTPNPRSRWLGSTGWVSLAAATCVIGLTVFVIEPGVDIIAPGSESLAPEIVVEMKRPASQTVKMEDLVPDARLNSDASVLGAHVLQAPQTSQAPGIEASESHTAPAAMMDQQSDALIAESIQLAAPAGAQVQTQSEAKLQVNSTIAIAREPDPVSNQASNQTSKAKPLAKQPEPMENRRNATAPSAVHKSMARSEQAVTLMAESDIVRQSLSNQELSNRLHKIRALLQSDQRAAAIQALQALIKQCPDCEIPISMQALLK